MAGERPGGPDGDAEDGGDRGSDDPDHIRFGVDGLDERLGYPLCPGSVLALSADPASPSEELLYPPAAGNPGRYLTTLRGAAEVRAHADRSVDAAIDVREATGSSLLDDPTGGLSGLDARSIVVLDPVTELEREGRERYRSFLDTLVRAVRTTESVAVLHCLRMNPRALQRDLTLAVADTVLELETYVEEDGGPVVTLAARKARFGRAPTEPVPLRFEDGPAIAETGE
ncbi:MAG: transcriptional regulator [Haloarculaceae archaeon]